MSVTPRCATAPRTSSRSAKSSVSRSSSVRPTPSVDARALTGPTSCADYHHDWILPSSIPRAEIIARAHALFVAKGIRPKQHLSEPRPGAVTVMERRAHADRCQRLPDELPDDMGAPGAYTVSGGRR